MRLSLPGAAADIAPAPGGQRLARGNSVPAMPGSPGEARARFKGAATAVRASRRIMHSAVIEMDGAEHAALGTVAHGEASAGRGEMQRAMRRGI